MKSYKQETTHALSASFSTDAFDCSDVDSVGVQIVATTSANTGTFTCQCSNDGTTWEDVSFDTPLPPLADANASIFASIADFPFDWFRINFVIGTGTNGSAVIKVYAKGS